MRTFVGSLVVMVTAMVFIGFGGCMKAREFRGGCEDYLELAGRAATVEMASMYLQRALGYMESNNLTSGYCDIFFHTPSSDLGLWYANVQGAYNETQAMLAQKRHDPGSIRQLDEVNLLVKIRLMTIPEKAWLYPHQRLWVIGWTVVFLGLVGAIIGCFAKSVGFSS